MWPPPLLEERPAALQVLSVSVLPVLFGGLCGYLLSRNGSLYAILTLVALLGGIANGFEHATPREGLLRGLFSAALFAIAIVVFHELGNRPADEELPAPLGVMAVIYTLIGGALGALGGWLRARMSRRRVDSGAVAGT